MPDDSRLLERLARAPVWAVAVLVGACVAVALLVGSRWSALALLPVLALLGWLSRLAWPALGPAERALRVVVLAALLAWVVATLAGA